MNTPSRLGSPTEIRAVLSTSEFCCDSIAHWWQRHGRSHYPLTQRLLILCDGGGSNASNRHVFKEALQDLADRLGLEIRVAHYPPGCSKYNPIEHRLFPHVTRKLKGLFLKSLEMVRDLSRRATTKTGLQVFARTLRGVYELGHRAKATSLHQLHLLFDPVLSRWNYTVLPKPLRDII